MLILINNLQTALGLQTTFSSKQWTMRQLHLYITLPNAHRILIKKASDILMKTWTLRDLSKIDSISVNLTIWYYSGIWLRSNGKPHQVSVYYLLMIWWIDSNYCDASFPSYNTSHCEGYAADEATVSDYLKDRS